MAALLEIHRVEHIDRVVRNLGVAHEHLLERALGDVLEYRRRAEEAGLCTPGSTHADHLAVAHGGEGRSLIHDGIRLVRVRHAGEE